ncbi:rhomboid family intramembrane serine protease [Tessaracoccus sp. OS52]|uniref:rhomboid family intramembrane serine protease n=1 Tax=Tessaracoccus sp. OS52 TaxID=2886691 RepID=UPI001D10E3E3|nr:rhomboid family intramembrane serine protease [Tessaracoccus sp. OS52]MCC2593677.1 rhomboid family intramembrane serine protease [Tessaracoccus sp. OS52]
MESAVQPVCYRHPDRPTRIVCQRCNRPICPDCMIPGAVGFQCPECVELGRRQTRQGVLPYGGRRSANPKTTSIVLIAVNVAVWLGVMLTGGAFGRLFDVLSIKALGYCLVNDGRILLVDESGCAAGGLSWVDGVASGGWWQLISSAFTHADPLHIAFNMLALWVLGPQLEQIFGRARFLAVYFVSAIVASAFIMWFSEPYTSTVGASGAIFGLMGAILLVAYKHKGNYQTILMWLGANVAITIFGSAYISWQGHLGGLVGGLLAALALMYLPKDKRKPWQWVLVIAIGVLALALITVRALTITV